MQIWWCNQGRADTWSDERKAGVVCSQKTDRDSLRRTVLAVKRGDVIVHYRKQKKAIVAVSVAQSDGVECAENDRRRICLYGAGWAVRTKYHDLEEPVAIKAVMAKLAHLKLENNPVLRTRDGSLRVRQAYFMPFSVEGLRILQAAGANSWPEEMLASGHQGTSGVLQIGKTYTRKALKRMFHIEDATINNGVFRPKGTNSIWLFVTERKTKDRVQFRDRLDGDDLHWQGQSTGRTDDLILNHQRKGFELLVFFRREKYQFEGAAFRYIGPHQFVSSFGSKPTNFLLRRLRGNRSALIAPDAANEKPFEPKDLRDARLKIERSIKERRGQRAFRNSLIDAYEGKCSISGCEVLDILEAAHICPYRGPATNNVKNGLLLRADLHTLFDCDLISIDPSTLIVSVAKELLASEYAQFHAARLNRPRSIQMMPSVEAFKARKKLRQSARRKA